MRVIFGLMLLVMAGMSVSGCVVEGGGWGWHHHHEGR
jgi:hypothetical protein